MSNDILHTLLIELALDRSTERTQEWVRGTWEQAKVWNDTALLAALAARLDLPGDLVEEAGKHTEIPIRVAYLARIDRDPEFICNALRAERRAGVLAGFYRTHPTPGTFMPIFEHAMTEKPTLTMAEAVLDAATTPSDNLTALTLAVVLPRYESLTEAQQTATERLIAITAKNSAVAERLLETLDTFDLPMKLSGFVLRTLGENGLRSERFTSALVSKLVEKPLAELVTCIAAAKAAGNSGARNYELRSYASLLAHGVHDIRQFVPAETLVEVRTKISEADLGELSPLTHKDSRRVYSREEVLELFSRGTTSQEQAVREVIEHSAEFLHDPAIVGALLDNIQLWSIVDDVFPDLTGKESAPMHVAIFEYNGGAHAARLYAYGCQSMTELHGIDPLGEPSTAWSRVATELTAWQGRVAGSTHYRNRHAHYAAQEFIDTCDDLDALTYLPWQTAEELVPVPYWGERRLKMMQAVANSMEQHLGDDRARWEAFVTLSNGYTGTVRELAKLAAQI